MEFLRRFFGSRRASANDLRGEVGSDINKNLSVSELRIMQKLSKRDLARDRAKALVDLREAEESSRNLKAEWMITGIKTSIARAFKEAADNGNKLLKDAALRGSNVANVKIWGVYDRRLMDDDGHSASVNAMGTGEQNFVDYYEEITGEQFPSYRSLRSTKKGPDMKRFLQVARYAIDSYKRNIPEYKLLEVFCKKNGYQFSVEISGFDVVLSLRF